MFLLSCENQKCEEYLEDIRVLKQAVADSSEYIELLRSPNVEVKEKLRLIDLALEGKVNEDVLSFLKLLCEKGRVELLSECIENYEKLYNQINSVIKANVISAVELTDDEKEKIIKGLERRTNKRVELVCGVDKSILGGIIINMEDAIIDGSLRRRIQEVKEVISSEPKT